LVGPLGFSLDNSKVKRAGLDYWKHVDLSVYDDYNHFNALNPTRTNRFFFSKFGKESMLNYRFPMPAVTSTAGEEELFLFFGSERVGLFDLIGAAEMEGRPVIHLPMMVQLLAIAVVVVLTSRSV